MIYIYIYVRLTIVFYLYRRTAMYIRNIRVHVVYVNSHVRRAARTKAFRRYGFVKCMRKTVVAVVVAGVSARYCPVHIPIYIYMYTHTPDNVLLQFLLSSSSHRHRYYTWPLISLRFKHILLLLLLYGVVSRSRGTGTTGNVRPGRVYTRDIYVCKLSDNK